MREQQDVIKEKLNSLANDALSFDAEGVIDRQLYNEEDLMDATLIFMHIIGNIGASYCLEKYGLDKWMKISEEFGENIQQSIELFTWIDTRKHFK